MGQKLRGLVGQGLDGRRPKSYAFTTFYPPGIYTFTVPRTGRWKFHIWGPGGSYSGADGSGSGGYCEITRKLTATSTVALVVAMPGSASTATFGDGTIVSAGSGGNISGGSAIGGDLNIPGSSGALAGSGLSGASGTGSGGGSGGPTNGGGGAPGFLPLRGGRGGDGSRGATSPGGGAGVVVNQVGGQGLIVTEYLY